LTVALLDPIYLPRSWADVIGSQPRFALAITDSQTATANSANSQSLQQ
jgi:hypothetical protein